MTGLLDRLAELQAEATERPWVWEPTGEKDNSWCLGTAVGPNDEPLAGELDQNDEFTVVDLICEHYGVVNTFSDADLIVAAVNALPTLLRIARAAEEALANSYGSETRPNYGSSRRTVHWDRLDSAKVAELRSALASLGDTPT